MGQAARGMHLVETVEDVASLQVGTPDKLAYVTQTTLSVDDAKAIVAALKARFPAIRGPKKDDICYATQNRQDAVKFMAPQCDVVIVVGSPNSSNSNRLREVAQHMGAQAYMVDRAADLRPEWIAGKRRVGVTAGASAPEVLVDELIARLKALGARERAAARGHHRARGVHAAARARPRRALGLALFQRAVAQLDQHLAVHRDAGLARGKEARLLEGQQDLRAEAAGGLRSQDEHVVDAARGVDEQAQHHDVRIPGR